MQRRSLVARSGQPPLLYPMCGATRKRRAVAHYGQARRPSAA